MTKTLSYFGPHFIVGISGPALAIEERKLLSDLRPAGIILFAQNINKQKSNWPAILKNLIEDVKSATANKHLIVSIDHEGGSVHRLPSPATHFPSAHAWHTRSKEVAKAMARELDELSINLSFAPVVDIWSEPNNTVIGKRAFSDQPDYVATQSVEFLTALEKEGVLGCGKHFPGHGATIADSHEELPILDVPLKILETRELVPFKAMINAGVHLIMTAHVLYPQLDNSYPATLSKTIIHDLLRAQLGYSNVVITDALEMSAMDSFSSIALATQVIQATADIFLVGQPKGLSPISRALEIATSLAQALDSGLISERLIQDSQKRIQNLLHYQQSIRKTSAHIGTQFAQLGCEAHQRLAKELSV